MTAVGGAMWIPRDVHAHPQRAQPILPLREAKKVLEASFQRSDIPRLIGCIAQHFPGLIGFYRCVVLHSWITTQPTSPVSPVPTLHCVGGRLALCLCLYFTKTSCCAAVGT